MLPLEPRMAGSQIIQLFEMQIRNRSCHNNGGGGVNFMAANEQIKQMRKVKILHLESFKIENGTLQLDGY